MAEMARAKSAASLARRVGACSLLWVRAYGGSRICAYGFLLFPNRLMCMWRCFSDDTPTHDSRSFFSFRAYMRTRRLPRPLLGICAHTFAHMDFSAPIYSVRFASLCTRTRHFLAIGCASSFPSSGPVVSDFRRGCIVIATSVCASGFLRVPPGWVRTYRIRAGKSHLIYARRVDSVLGIAAFDTTFTATLYASPSASARYADDPGARLREVCVWQADVGVLPAFRAAALSHPHGGFYTDFAVGLELDSAEVRGVLLSAGTGVSPGEGGGMEGEWQEQEEWGRVIFAFV
ncbi:hypothetical protein DFH09DRAFT_1328413 [Mycena vulgaris]|nr:hypothetical protein DFH09DRAFT_1328413 [Mycena vulgaris]